MQRAASNTKRRANGKNEGSTKPSTDTSPMPVCGAMRKVFAICGYVVLAVACGCARHRAQEQSSSTTVLPFFTGHQERFAERALRSPNEAIQAQGAEARRSLY
jgi:hypothetical protein